jgi:hypothetical protein
MEMTVVTYGIQITKKYEDLHNASVNIATSYRPQLDFYTVEVLHVADSDG